MSMKSRQDAIDWRESPRVRVDFPVDLILGRAELTVRLVDVSETGMRIRSRTAHPVGEAHVIQVSFPDGRHRFKIMTRWDWFENDHFLIGAELASTDPQEMERWKAIVARMPKMTESGTGSVKERRKAPRIQKWLPLLYESEHQWVKGVLQNVSENCEGALIVVRSPDPPGDVVTFKLRIEDRTCIFRALTVWWQFADGYYSIGIECIEAEDPEARILPLGETSGIRKESAPERARG